MKKNKPPLVFWRLLYRQPSTSIGTLTLILIICSANATLFRLPFHAPIPTLHYAKASLRSRSRVAVRDRNTATRSAKKSFLRVGINNAFFCSLGVFIVGIYTNAPDEKSGLFAHFFRRLPKGIYLKNKILQWQSSKKIERKMKLIRQSLVPNLKFWAFFGKLF
jgi:hypothetical protein